MSLFTANPLPDPPCPLPAKLRTEIAYRRAQGSSWEELAAGWGYDPDALRFATEIDPEFDAEQQRAWDEAWQEAEAEAIARLRVLASGEGELAIRAATILMRHADDLRREEARRAVLQRERDALAVAIQKHDQLIAVCLAQTQKFREAGRS